MTDKQETTEAAPAQERQETDAQEIRGFVKIDAASYTRMVAELEKHRVMVKTNAHLLLTLTEAAKDAVDKAKADADAARKELEVVSKELGDMKYKMADKEEAFAFWFTRASQLEDFLREKGIEVPGHATAKKGA